MTAYRTAQISDALKTLARLFNETGFPLYAVGGMVRNPILGFNVSDCDITSAMRPDAVMELARRNGIGIVEKGVRFGMVELHIGGESFEHTTFRSDVYSIGGTHRPEAIRFSDSIDEDAYRRDFTVNAIYLDIASGRIIDPTGGIDDAKRRLIRATSEDPSVILRDDGLRIMRMVRFAGELGFCVEQETFDAAQKNVGGLKDISHERVRDEFNKILMCDVRYGAGKASLENALFMLRDVGAIEAVLGELYLGRGIVQRSDYHAHDVLDHCLHSAAEALPARIDLRLAALLHDVGKPKVFIANGKMLYHDIEGEIIAKEILERLRYDKSTIRHVATLVRWHMFDLNGNAKEGTLRERFVRLGYDTSMDLAAIREADVHGSGIISGEVKTAVKWRRLLANMKEDKTPFSMSELCCSGRDIMEWTGIAAGSEIGAIKEKLFYHCARRPSDNTRAKLARLVRLWQDGGVNSKSDKNIAGK